MTVLRALKTVDFKMINVVYHLNKYEHSTTPSCLAKMDTLRGVNAKGFYLLLYLTALRTLIPFKPQLVQHHIM